MFGRGGIISVTFLGRKKYIKFKSVCFKLVKDFKKYFKLTSDRTPNCLTVGLLHDG